MKLVVWSLRMVALFFGTGIKSPQKPVILSQTRFLSVLIEIGRGFWFDNFFDFLDRPTRHFFRFFAFTNANSDICLSVETLSFVQKALQLRFEIALPPQGPPVF